MLLPTILVTTLLFSVQAERNLTADVHAFVAKFRTMNETEDVLSGLERLADDCRELFALGRHVKDLMVTFNETGEATDEETKSLAELNKLFDHSFVLQSLPLAKSSMKAGVLEPTLENVRSLMDHITNATERRSLRIFDQNPLERLKTVKTYDFFGQHEPMAVLEVIDSNSRVGCRLPTKESIKMLVKLQNAFLRLEIIGKRTWNQNETKSVHYVMNGIFGLATAQKTDEHVKQFIQRLENLNSTAFDDVILVLHTGYENMRVTRTSMCMLEGAFHTNTSTFNQTSMLSKLQLIHKDLIRVQLLEWAMRSVLEVDDEYYDRDVEIVALSIDRTAHFLVKWTRTVQNISWPEVGTEFAKRAIEEEPISIDAYNETARKVQKAFEDHGLSSYSYQVLVVHTSEVDLSWTVGSTKKDDYTNITNFNGLDIHVFRFNKTEITARSGKAQKWMKKNAKEIQKDIRSHAMQKPTSVLSHLQIISSNAPIYSDNLYRSVILLKKAKISTASSIEMPMGYAVSEEASYQLEVTRNSYSVLDKGRETVYSWKGLFFLNMLLPTLLVTTLLCCVNAKRNLTAEAQAFVSKFREINGSNYALGSLERIGANSRELFRLGRPIGQLLSSFNSTGKVTEDEKNALAELHRLFDHKFDQRPTNANLTDYDSYYSGYSFGPMMDYARVYLAKLTNVTERANDHNSYTLQNVKQMRMGKAYTSYLFNPLAVLDMIDTQSRLGCRLPTKEGIRLVGRVQDAFWRVELGARGRWNETDFEKFDSYKTGLLYLISRESEVAAEKLIKNLNGLSTPSVDEALAVVGSSHMEILSEQTASMMSTCALWTSSDKSAFNQTVLMQRLGLLHRDLIRVQLLEWALSSFTEVDDESYNADAEIATLMIERTAKFLVKWTRTVQNVSWPEIGIEFAKRTIDHIANPVSIDDYNEIAGKVQTAFEEHGLYSYSFQVLVVPTSAAGVSLAVGSTRMEDYANITNFNGLDIHVFRFNFTEERKKDRKRKTIAWRAEKKEGLLKEIRTGALSIPSALLSSLQTESPVGPIYSEDRFRSVLLLRQVTNSSADASVPIGHADRAPFTKLETTRTSYSVLDHGKETTYSWKAFFFL